jgi:hypothetical protein
MRVRCMCAHAPAVCIVATQLVEPMGAQLHVQPAAARPRKASTVRSHLPPAAHKSKSGCCDSEGKRVKCYCTVVSLKKLVDGFDKCRPTNVEERHDRKMIGREVRVAGLRHDHDFRLHAYSTAERRGMENPVNVHA